MKYLKWEDFPEDGDWNLLDELLLGKDISWVWKNSIMPKSNHEFTRNDVLVCQNPEFKYDGFHWILTNFREPRKKLDGLYKGKMVIDYDVYDYNLLDGKIIGWDRDSEGETFSGGLEKETEVTYPIKDLMASINLPKGEPERSYLLNINLSKEHNYLNWIDKNPWEVKE